MFNVPSKQCKLILQSTLPIGESALMHLFLCTIQNKTHCHFCVHVLFAFGRADHSTATESVLRLLYDSLS